MTLLSMTKILFSFILISLIASGTVKAGVFRVNADLESSRFLRGIDITDGQPALSLSVDWSSDTGLFSGANCYRSDSQQGASLSNGCQFYLGYFKALNNNQAISFALNGSDYVRTADPQWDYLEATIDWNLNKETVISFGFSDDWFGRGFKSINIDAKKRFVLNDQFSISSSVGLLAFESDAPISSLPLLELGLNYAKNRWNIGLSSSWTSSDVQQLTPQFSTNQPEFQLSVSYRLY